MGGKTWSSRAPHGPKISRCREGLGQGPDDLVWPLGPLGWEAGHDAGVTDFLLSVSYFSVVSQALAAHTVENNASHTSPAWPRTLSLDAGAPPPMRQKLYGNQAQGLARPRI